VKHCERTRSAGRRGMTVSALGAVLGADPQDTRGCQIDRIDEDVVERVGTAGTVDTELIGRGVQAMESELSRDPQGTEAVLCDAHQVAVLQRARPFTDMVSLRFAGPRIEMVQSSAGIARNPESASAQPDGAAAGGSRAGHEGFYKELFVDFGVGLDHLPGVPAADGLGWEWELVATDDANVQHSYMWGNANDDNGVLLYPDREPRFMLMYTGGGYGDRSSAVGATGIKNVQDFFNNGGSYVGTCNGNYMPAGTQSGSGPSEAGNRSRVCLLPRGCRRLRPAAPERSSSLLATVL
jgi:hypothetical protein